MVWAAMDHQYQRLVADVISSKVDKTSKSTRMSGDGTFRTWRDVRLESANRLKADMINAEKFQKWFELPKADLAALAAKAKGK